MRKTVVLDYKTAVNIGYLLTVGFEHKLKVPSGWLGFDVMMYVMLKAIRKADREACRGKV